MGVGKEYFEFTRRERAGIIGLVILILILAGLPVVFDRFQPSASLTFEGVPMGADTVHSMNENKRGYGRFRAKDGAFGRSPVKTENQLFRFDPNTLTPEGWKKLGLKEWTISTIRRFLEKGGRFRKAEDIGRIYGLKTVDFERLLPYVRIRQESSPAAGVYRGGRSGERLPGPAIAFPERRKDTLAGNFRRENKYQPGQNHVGRGKPWISNPAFTMGPIEINSADSSAFESLPGIGGKLAARILLFREKLGGFYCVEQIKEVFGLKDSTYLMIAVRLTCNASLVKKIGINDADRDLLKQHPYIRWATAIALVNYRTQHGRFDSLDALHNIASIDPKSLEKLLPYLYIEPVKDLSGH